MACLIDDDLLPHVSGDGHSWCILSNGKCSSTRSGFRWTRVAEDDEALRSDGGRGLARRDRPHRDIRWSCGSPRLSAMHSACTSIPGRRGGTEPAEQAARTVETPDSVPIAPCVAMRTVPVLSRRGARGSGHVPEGGQSLGGRRRRARTAFAKGVRTAPCYRGGHR